MDADRFDALTRSLTEHTPRRRLIAGLIVAPGLLAAGASNGAAAKNRKKKLKRNEFGCVNVGGKCRGRDKNCCSGICRGKKPEKGEKDNSRCVAHDAQGCQAGQIEGFCGGTNVNCTTSNGNSGKCNTTTGNAGYCADSGDCSAGPCKKDADCIPRFRRRSGLRVV